MYIKVKVIGPSRIKIYILFVNLFVNNFIINIDRHLKPFEGYSGKSSTFIIYVKVKLKVEQPFLFEILGVPISFVRLIYMSIDIHI